MPLLSLDHLTVMGATPAELATAAAEAGFDAIGPIAFVGGGFKLPVIPLELGTPETEEMRLRLRDTGVVINNTEGFLVTDHIDWNFYNDRMEMVAELGTRRISTVIFDSDRTRATDSLARLAEMAGTRNIGVALEFAPLSKLPKLNEAVALVKQTGSGNIKILVDILHFCQSGDQPSDMAAVVSANPALIACAQICDGPAHPTFEDYAKSALFERQLPGEGELPVKDFLRALPPGATIGAEIPRKSATARGDSYIQIARDAYQALNRQLEAIA